MRPLARLIGALLMLSCTSLARADLLPEDEAQCDGKRPGDACATGLCTASTCQKLDYQHWDPEAGVPGTLEYACVICVADGRAHDAGPATVPSTPSDETDSSEEANPAGAQSDAPPKQPPEASEGDDQKDGKGSSSSGCSVDFTQTATKLGPWLLAAGFGLMVSRRRPRA